MNINVKGHVSKFTKLLWDTLDKEMNKTAPILEFTI